MPGCACSSPSQPPPVGHGISSKPPPNIPKLKAEPRGSERVSKQTLENFSQIAGGQGQEDSAPPEPLPDAMRATRDSNVSGTSKKVKYQKWVSPLRRFDVFATEELRKIDISTEDFPKLTVPTVKGLHRCRVQALTYHQVDTSIELNQELRNIGIQQTTMLEMLEKLTKAEAACRFQGAVRAAEIAAMAAPPELAEEAAVAASRGYTVETREFSKKMSSGENPVEILGYIGCTRPNNF